MHSNSLDNREYSGTAVVPKKRHSRHYCMHRKPKKEHKINYVSRRERTLPSIRPPRYSPRKMLIHVVDDDVPTPHATPSCWWDYLCHTAVRDTQSQIRTSVPERRQTDVSIANGSSIIGANITIKSTLRYACSRRGRNKNSLHRSILSITKYVPSPRRMTVEAALPRAGGIQYGKEVFFSSKSFENESFMSKIENWNLAHNFSWVHISEHSISEFRNFRIFEFCKVNVLQNERRWLHVSRTFFPEKRKK